MKKTMGKFVLLGCFVAITGSLNGQQEVMFPRTDRLAETEKGKEIGIGSASVVSPGQLEAYTWNTVKLSYTAGKAGIKAGGGVRFTFMHMIRWTTFQTDRPEDHSYLTVKCSNGNPLKVLSFINRPWSEIIPSEYMDKYDPNYNVVEVIVQGEGLKEGETIDVIIGDTSQGSPGVLVQYFDEHPFIIETLFGHALLNGYLKNPIIGNCANKLLLGVIIGNLPFIPTLSMNPPRTISHPFRSHSLIVIFGSPWG